MCNKEGRGASSLRRMNNKNKVVIGVVLVLIVAGVVWGVVRPWLQNRTIPVTVMETIERPELNISFAFPSGEDAYSYFEPQFEASSTNGPLAGFIMLKSDAYQAYQADGFVGEAPPSMSIFIYEEKEEIIPLGATNTESVDRATKIRLWAEANSSLTSYNLALTAPQDTLLDGAKAIRYKTDGLYPQDVYVVFHQNNFYVITGQYDGESDPQYQAFQELVKSLLFL